MTDSPTKEFLAELTELTKRYRIKIAGCGCCDSPWLDDVDGKDGHYEVDNDQGYEGANLRFVQDDDKEGT